MLTLIAGFDAWLQQRRIETIVDNNELSEQLLQEGCILSKWFSINEIQVHPQAPMEALPPSREIDNSGDRFQVAPFIRGVNSWPRVDSSHPLLWQVGSVLVRLDEAVQAYDSKQPSQFGKNYHSQRLILDSAAFIGLLLAIHYARASIMHLFFAISIDFLAYAAVRLPLQAQRLSALEPVLERALQGMEEEMLERTVCWRVRLQEQNIFGDVPALEWSYVPASKC